MCLARLVGGQGGRSGERTMRACRCDMRFVEMIMRWVVRMKNMHSLIHQLFQHDPVGKLTQAVDLARHLCQDLSLWRLTKHHYESLSCPISYMSIPKVA